MWCIQSVLRMILSVAAVTQQLPGCCMNDCQFVQLASAPSSAYDKACSDSSSGMGVEQPVLLRPVAGKFSVKLARPIAVIQLTVLGVEWGTCSSGDGFSCTPEAGQLTVRQCHSGWVPGSSPPGAVLVLRIWAVLGQDRPCRITTVYSCSKRQSWQPPQAQYCQQQQQQQQQERQCQVQPACRTAATPGSSSELLVTSNGWSC